MQHDESNTTDTRHPLVIDPIKTHVLKVKISARLLTFMKKRGEIFQHSPVELVDVDETTPIFAVIAMVCQKMSCESLMDTELRLATKDMMLDIDKTLSFYHFPTEVSLVMTHVKTFGREHPTETSTVTVCDGGKYYTVPLLLDKRMVYIKAYLKKTYDTYRENTSTYLTYGNHVLDPRLTPRRINLKPGSCIFVHERPTFDEDGTVKSHVRVEPLVCFLYTTRDRFSVVSINLPFRSRPVDLKCAIKLHPKCPASWKTIYDIRLIRNHRIIPDNITFGGLDVFENGSIYAVQDPRFDAHPKRNLFNIINAESEGDVPVDVVDLSNTDKSTTTRVSIDESERDERDKRLSDKKRARDDAGAHLSLSDFDEEESERDERLLDRKRARDDAGVHLPLSDFDEEESDEDSNGLRQKMVKKGRRSWGGSRQTSPPLMSRFRKTTQPVKLVVDDDDGNGDTTTVSWHPDDESESDRGLDARAGAGGVVEDGGTPRDGDGSGLSVVETPNRATPESVSSPASKTIDRRPLPINFDATNHGVANFTAKLVEVLLVNSDPFVFPRERTLNLRADMTLFEFKVLVASWNHDIEADDVCLRVDGKVVHVPSDHVTVGACFDEASKTGTRFTYTLSSVAEGAKVREETHRPVTWHNFVWKNHYRLAAVNTSWTVEELLAAHRNIFPCASTGTYVTLDGCPVGSDWTNSLFDGSRRMDIGVGNDGGLTEPATTSLDFFPSDDPGAHPRLADFPCETIDVIFHDISMPNSTRLSPKEVRVRTDTTEFELHALVAAWRKDILNNTCLWVCDSADIGPSVFACPKMPRSLEPFARQLNEHSERPVNIAFRCGSMALVNGPKGSLPLTPIWTRFEWRSCTRLVPLHLSVDPEDIRTIFRNSFPCIDDSDLHVMINGRIWIDGTLKDFMPGFPPFPHVKLAT